MSLPCPPPLGHPVPALPHAISVQLPRWQDMVDFGNGAKRVRSVQQSGYPRSFLHRDVQRLHDLCADRFAAPDEACLLFPTGPDAAACKRYLCQPPHGDSGLDEAEVRVVPLDFDDVCFEHGRAAAVTLHAVLLPQREIGYGMVYWRLAGSGISSRLAEDLVASVGTAREAAARAHTSWPLGAAGQRAQHAIRQRVAGLLGRAPPGGPRRAPAVAADDVVLFPTGMAAICHLTRALRDWPGTKAVVFGFPYELTLKAQQDLGRHCVFYGFGTLAEMELLEDYLHMMAQQGRTIQAVWCECASNPLLRTVDLDRMRRLADRYGFVVIVDDTIGSSANVDVLAVADVVVTSLTKSFSGHADVMGGSIALNPASPFYARLRTAVAAGYTNRLYGRDAVKLEANSRGVLARVATMNANAAQLVALLQPFADDPACPLRRVYYPSTCSWSAANYRARMRPATADFVPGYGGLFTLEFDKVDSSAAFFDALRVCKGPSLGANVTLAQPYVQTVFAREKAWAARYGLSETIVRISVGIEDIGALTEVFLDAMSAVTCHMHQDSHGPRKTLESNAE